MLRREFLTITAAAATVIAAGPALALSPERAKALVDQLVGDLNGVISSGRSEAAMTAEFERIFRRHADVSTIAAYALGVDGRRASAAQKRAFEEAFAGYVARKYGSRLRQFTGGRLDVTEVRPAKSFHEVSCTAHLPGAAPFAVDFMVSDRSGRALFTNVKIKGVNLQLTERTEIGAMIDRRGGDLDAMIEALRRAG